MIHYTIQCQEARAIFEPKTIRTQALNAIAAAQNTLEALTLHTLSLLEINTQTFVAFPAEEFKEQDITLAYKNKCLHDDTFVVKIVEESKP